MLRRTRTVTRHPDWESLADGRLHRLRSGRDYAGDARPHIRAARGAASDMGLHAIVTRDDLGKTAFLWIQFVAGVTARDRICPGCGSETLTQRGLSIARCEDCGNAYSLRDQWAEAELQRAKATAAKTPETPASLAPDAPWQPDGSRDGDDPATITVRSILTHPALPPVATKTAELLRDADFMTTVGQVLKARATRMDLVRLWTLWEAVGLAPAQAAAAVGSTWAGGGAFLTLAMKRRGSGGAGCFVVDHPVYREYTAAMARELDEEVRTFLESEGATVIDGDMSESESRLTGREYGVVHLDLSAADEIHAALTFFHEHLGPGGVIVVEDYRIPSAKDRSPGQVALGVDAFLEQEAAGYVTWRSDGRQLILLRRS
jgi:ribosomal protein L37AE/L43A